jgi:tetratricopeptide (TPR) repeat protein
MNKTCLVVMNYGVRADYATGRHLDLNKTYKKIVKPAVEAAGFTCIRADRIRYHGIINVPMFQMLLHADVVIADLSVYDPDAFYDLGIRHARRPHTTIAIAEQAPDIPFDVYHSVIGSFERLGAEDRLNAAETLFQQELEEILMTIVRYADTDHAIHTFSPGWEPPQIERFTSNRHLSEKDQLDGFIDEAEQALYKNQFRAAKKWYKKALDIDNGSAYTRQKMTLATYKSKEPTQLSALKAAESILSPLIPEESTDPETLGLTGAIFKRLWEETHQPGHLQQAIGYFEKGFHTTKDYYNGINLAYLLNVHGRYQKSRHEAIADYVLAKRVRMEVIGICEKLAAEGIEARSDRYWIYATLEEAYLGVGNLHKYEELSVKAASAAKGKWERETTVSQIGKLKALLEASPLN